MGGDEGVEGEVCAEGVGGYATPCRVGIFVMCGFGKVDPYSNISETMRRGLCGTVEPDFLEWRRIAQKQAMCRSGQLAEAGNTKKQATRLRAMHFFFS